MGLKEQIAQQMRSNNIHTCSILFNAEYFMYSGKQVMCELRKGDADDIDLRFFIKKKTVDGDGRVPYKNGYYTLAAMVRSTKVYGKDLPIQLDANSFKIKMYPEYKLLAIESLAYVYARELAEEQIKRQKEGTTLNLQSVSIPTTQSIDPQYLAEFLSNFWSYSRIAYRNFVYCTSNSRDSRFIKTLYKVYSIYKVMDVFVPVIINSNIIFNPLQDDAVLNSNLYKMAIERGRKASLTTESAETVAYFLTQEEICRAFHLTRFTRFTASFAYDVFMGLLYPGNNNEFPSLKTSVYHGPVDATAYGLPRIMTEAQYQEELQKITTASAFSGSPTFVHNGIESSYEDFVKVMGAYVKRDSMWLECQTYLGIITRMGACVLDGTPKPTVEMIYSIVAEAQL